MVPNRPKTNVEVVPQSDALKGERAVANRPIKLGEFGELSGDVLVRSTEHEGKRLAKKAGGLITGSVVETGDFGKAEIKLADGSVLRLGYNTVLDVSHRHFVMRSGVVFAQVVHTANNQRFAIKTPAATAEVLGTEFALAVDRLRQGSSLKPRTVLQVSKGRVRFYNGKGQVVATELTESTAIAGGEPSDPKRILQLKDHLFVHEVGHTHLTEYTSRLSASDARARLVLPGTGSSVVPTTLANELAGATQPALSGHVEAAIEALRELSRTAAHPAVLNNLGIAYEMHDEMGPAIRSYQSAVRLDPRQPLYHYNLGFALQQIGNTARSLEELGAAVQIDPRFETAVAQLAHDYDLLGQHSDALAVIDTGLRANPSSARLWMFRGTVFFDSGRFVEAERDYQHAVKLSPRNADLWYQLGFVYRFLERPKESEQAFRKAVEIVPRDPASLKELASALWKLERNNEAEEMYLKALEIAPDWSLAHDSYAWFLENQGRNEDAENHYRAAIALDPSNGSIHNNLALLLRDNFKGRQKEAEAEFRKAIGLDPSHVSFYHSLAALLAAEDRNKEAEELYRSAIELDRTDASSYERIGSFYRDKGRLKECILSYRQAIRLSPKAAHLYGMLGRALSENHAWTEAVGALRHSLEIEPSGEQAVFAKCYLAFSLVHTADIAEASRLSASALESDPMDSRSQAMRAYVLAHLQAQLDEALELALRCVQTAGAGAFDWEVLGLVYLKRGESDLAIKPLVKAVTSYGRALHAAEALVYLGQAYEARNEPGAAAEAYRRALAIEPRNAAASNGLKRCGR